MTLSLHHLVDNLTANLPVCFTARDFQLLLGTIIGCVLAICAVMLILHQLRRVRNRAGEQLQLEHTF